jgi:hypothetical protein
MTLSTSKSRVLLVAVCLWSAGVGGCGSEQKVVLPENPTPPPKDAVIITSGQSMPDAETTQRQPQR